MVKTFFTSVKIPGITAMVRGADAWTQRCSCVDKAKQPVMHCDRLASLDDIVITLLFSDRDLLFRLDEILETADEIPYEGSWLKLPRSASHRLISVKVGIVYHYNTCEIVGAHSHVKNTSSLSTSEYQRQLVQDFHLVGGLPEVYTDYQKDHNKDDNASCTAWEPATFDAAADGTKHRTVKFASQMKAPGWLKKLIGWLSSALFATQIQEPWAISERFMSSACFY